MTGENFTRVDCKDYKLEQLKSELQGLRERWAFMMNVNNIDDFTFDDFHKIEERIERLKAYMYRYYHYKVRGNYDLLHDFERRYLW